MGASAGAARPSVSAILAEIGGAVLGGVVLAPICGYALGWLLSGADLGMGLLSLMVFAGTVGFGAGAGAGAALAGRLLGQGGSLWLAVGGGAVSSVVVILALRLLRINVGGLLNIFWVAVPIVILAAVAGYNLRRR